MFLSTLNNIFENAYTVIYSEMFTIILFLWKSIWLLE